MEIKIEKQWITQEPQACEKQGCAELNNGLMCYSIYFGDGFCMGMWLCDKHSKQFDKRMKDKSNIPIIFVK